MYDPENCAQYAQQRRGSNHGVEHGKISFHPLDLVQCGHLHGLGKPVIPMKHTTYKHPDHIVGSPLRRALDVFIFSQPSQLQHVINERPVCMPVFPYPEKASL